MKVLEEQMDCGEKIPQPFKYQTSDILEHLTQKSSGKEEKISISDTGKNEKWIAVLPVIIRG